MNALQSSEFPLLIILTHKHGACVMFCTQEAHFKECFESDVIFQDSFLYSKEKTAESLCSIVEECLQKKSFELSSIKTIAIGAGPGSFTGLRLGFAFANGLSLASPRCFLTFETEYREEDRFVWLGESDMRLAIKMLHSGNFSRLSTPFALPQYGKDPTPVVLKKQNNT